MRVLVTGHLGYIGSVLTDLLIDRGLDVYGCDAGFFKDSLIGPAPKQVLTVRSDIRDLAAEDLEGFDSIVHLAALSNDPLGDLNPELTLEINTRATQSVATAAKRAGVQRFIFASSCSLYGGSDVGLLTEDAAMNPVTPYGESKVLAEEKLAAMNDDHFAVVSLRNATAYGASPRLRGDIVVNELLGMAVTTGQVVLRSDGSPWRPLVHIRDISEAIHACLAAPIESVGGAVFNVVPGGENYQVADIARAVTDAVPGSTLQIGEGAGPDIRDYRVDGSRILSAVEGFDYSWSLASGIAEMISFFSQHGLESSQLAGRYRRLHRLRELMDDGSVDRELRWVP